MLDKSHKILSYEDYGQSANSLFHFMKKGEYLETILKKRAIIPRYCMEDISYLDINFGEMVFKEVAILQKCFCDIPLHKIAHEFELNGVGKAYEELSDKEKELISKNNTHTEFYGEYAIAFSKRWAENKNLQPVHYLNEQSIYTKEFKELFKNVLNEDNLPEEFSNDVLNRLSYIKPLRGIMKRSYSREGGENLNIELYKNFHDEQEWRYVPSSDMLKKARVESIIANPNILSLHNGIFDINNSLENEKFNSLWIKYDYDDIRYIIVPNIYARIDVIKMILSIPDERFDENLDIDIQKHILISKILVLDEVRKDW